MTRVKYGEIEIESDEPFLEIMRAITYLLRKDFLDEKPKKGVTYAG